MASSSMADSTKTAAELMQERHEAAQNHHVTVEDTVDVDDLEHPPPPHTTSTPEPLKDISNSQPMSAKAAGKQRAHANAPALDTTDEEAFPSLGGTPKPRAAANTSSWTSKSFTTPAVNGTGPTTARQASSGTSTPSSNRGLGTPTYAQSARPSDFGQAPQPMSLPGQYQATFTFENEELNRETLTSQQIASLSKKYGVSITTRTKGGEKGTGSTYIDIRGSKGAVEKLRPEVEKIFSQTVTKDVSVPASIKSHIIGRGGSNIERLEKQFKVKLKIQDSKDRSPSEMATVKVSGYGPRVRSAVEAIRDLVKEKQPKVSLPVENVPPHVFPFINARHGPQIRQWQQEHGLQIEIPDSEQDAINARVPLRAPRRTPSVTVNGDLNAAKQAHSDLTKLIEALQDELQSQEHPFPRSSHPFIIGDRGVTQEDFLNETGCVILLPEDDSEDVIVWGPENRLDEGYNKIMELAGRLKRETVDIYKPFAAAPKGSEIHARAFQRYLHDRAVIEDLQRRHNADIVFPSFSDPSSYWTVVSEDQRGVLQGRSDLMKIIAAHPPERLSIIDEVDPFFHRHLSDMCEVALTDMGVRMILPDSADEHVVLVYEGAPQTPDTPFEVSRQKPSSEEIAEFQEALKEAYAHILGLIDDKEVAERSVPIPQKYHNDIRRYTDDLPKPAGSRFPIEVNFAAPLPRRLDLPDDVSPEDFIYLRGQGEDALEELQRQILQELSEIQENEKQRNHKTSFDFPDKLKDRLVGKGGAHINDLRKRFNVEIDTKSPGMVNIRGPPKYAKPCQAEISRLEKVWADEVTLRVKVDPRYVGQVIGTGGENLKKLRKRGNDQVDIRAPPSSKFDESQSIADTASDAGSTRAPRAKDEFIIRGPNKLALEIKSEIEHLYNYVKENSHEATVVVAKSQLPSLIGRGGTEIEQLRRETGARIDLPKNADSDRVPIVIKGTKQQVEKAKGEIQKRSKAFDDVVIRKVEIDQKHHPELIGPQGSCFTCHGRDLVANLRQALTSKTLSRKLELGPRKLSNSPRKVSFRTLSASPLPQRLQISL